MLPDGNYVLWCVGKARPRGAILGVEAVFFHRDGRQDTVQVHIAFRDESRHYRLFLARQPNRRFSGPCEVIDENQPGSREVCTLEGVLCDGAGDHGLILGSGRWPVRGVGDCEWMIHLRKLQRHLVNPNMLLYDADND